MQNKLDSVFNVPKATRNGKRSSTRELLLDMEKQFHDLLTIKTHSLVSKVVSNKENRATGVEVLEGKNLYKASPKFDASVKGKQIYHRANKEIILSGGAYNTPPILMLSGIGDPLQLREHGIETLINRPGVGKNLQDRYETSVVTELVGDFKLLKDCTFGEPNDPCMKKYKENPTREVYGTNGVLGGIIKKSSTKRKDPNLFIFGLPGKFNGYYKGWSKDAIQSNYFT